MDERIVQFRVGVVVLATAIITAILIVVFSERSPFERYVKYSILFPQAPGVTVDTPVRKSGILIGRVAGIDFTEEGQVLVTVSLRESVHVRQNEVPRIKPSLLGDATIEFVSSSDLQAPKEPIAPGSELAGVVVASPLDVLSELQGDLRGAVVSLGNAGEQVAQLAGRINSLLDPNDRRFDRVVEKTELALDTFNRTVGRIDQALGDEELNKKLKKVLTDLPELMDETRETLVGLQRAATAANQNLENLKGFTTPLGERGPTLIRHVESSVANLDDLLSQFVRFGEALNRPQGSLGQLINNPDLYQNLNRTSLQLLELSRQLRPILDDVRVFTDKIARDPSQIGVGGAIHRQAPIK